MDRRNRHWFLNYLDGVLDQEELNRSLGYSVIWLLIYLSLQLVSGGRGLNSDDTLAFFGAFVGVPFTIFYGGGLYFSWKDRNIYRDEEGWNRYKDTNELVKRKKNH